MVDVLHIHFGVYVNVCKPLYFQITPNLPIMVKQAKGEGQPKRPMSAYFLWMNAEGRDMVKKNNPDAPITEVSKKCGEEWRNLDEKTKKKYEKMQEEAKKKYDIDYKEWLENGGEEALKQAKDDKKEKKKASKSSK